MKNTLGNNLRSLLFDDDTWNLGHNRISKICDGLKNFNMPWTMMGRIDTSKPELYDKMVDSGCVGMRFGIETFNQELSDNVKKHMNTKTAYDNLQYLVTRFSNMEFHFTTMKNFPGEKPGSWEKDQEILKDLQEIGKKTSELTTNIKTLEFFARETYRMKKTNEVIFLFVPKSEEMEE